jgi:hypothetical protein
LLYAHYEGFCKFAITAYYDEIARIGMTCGQLPEPTMCFALSQMIKKMRNQTDSEFVRSVLNFHGDHLSAVPIFPSVETDSNLWPSKLREILNAADIHLSELENHHQKIRTLVARRNKIAHGERDIILEFDYYVQFEEAFKNIAYDLAYKIDEKISRLRQSLPQASLVSR